MYAHIPYLYVNPRPGSRDRPHGHTPRVASFGSFFLGFRPQTNGGGKKLNAALKLGAEKFDFA